MCTRLWVLAFVLLLLAACDRSSSKPPSNPGDGAGQTTGQPSAQPTGESGTATTPLPPGVGVQGAPCAEGNRCAQGLKCLEYYGVAGPSGPKFATCEIPCPTGKCPQGQACVAVSDGPGRVCQPASPSQ